MSDRVAALTAALSERRLELENAERSHARHEGLLETASAELAASNGDFEIWQAIDQRVRFERRQVERYQGIVEQCRANVQCAETALANAQREAAIAELESLEAQQTELDREALAKAAELYRGTCALLASVQPSVELAKQRAEQLRRLGVMRPARHPIHELWLALMGANPGQGPAYWNDASKFETDLVGNIQNAMQTLTMDARQIATLRQSFGDASAVIPEAPKVAPPPKPIQVDDFRDGVSERHFRGLRYQYETWYLAPDGRQELRLLLPDESSLPFGVTIEAESPAELEHGLTARLCKTSDGHTRLLAPSKSLVARATDGVRELARGVSAVLGLNEA